MYRVRSHGQKIGMLTLDRCVFTSSLWSNPIDVSQILPPSLTTLSYSLIWVRQTQSQQITILIKRLTPRKWSKFVLQLSRSPLTSNWVPQWHPKYLMLTDKCTTTSTKPRNPSTKPSNPPCTRRCHSTLCPITTQAWNNWKHDNYKQIIFNHSLIFNFDNNLT